MKTRFQERFENALGKMVAGLSKPKGRKSMAKVLERIGRLKEKHRAISGCYDVRAIPSEDGLTAVRVEWNVVPEKLASRLTGHYYLRSTLQLLWAACLGYLSSDVRPMVELGDYLNQAGVFNPFPI